MTELRDLMPQLARRLTSDFDFYHRSFDFLDVLSEYGAILDYLWEILFCPSLEPETKAVEVVKAFLDDEKKSAAWLRDRLREIWDEYEKKTKDKDDELPF
jgi:RNAse (barnase) inhibitor barstar